MALTEAPTADMEILDVLGQVGLMTQDWNLEKGEVLNLMVKGSGGGCCAGGT